MELYISLSFSEKYQYTHKYIRRPTYPHRVVEYMGYANYLKCYGISPSHKLLPINSPGNLSFFTYKLDELQRYGELLVPLQPMS
jgi:hypothetical protein